MKTVNRFFSPVPVASERGICFHADDAQTQKKDMALAMEHQMDVYVNEVLTMRLICTPSDLPELILGRLYTEGMIDSVDDVEEIYVCQDGVRARVFLTRDRDPEKNRQTQENPVCALHKDGEDTGRTAADHTYVETTPSCCTGNRILTDRFVSGAPLQRVEPILWKKEWIFSLARRFREDLPVYSRTSGVHSCFLAVRDRILYICEDLGRHNAMDKVLGYALEEGINLKEAILYTSGRVPTDMTIKAIRAGVPVLASKGAVTDMAVAMAREYGLTLIARARPDSMTICSGMPPEESDLDRQTIEKLNTVRKYRL